MRLKRILSLCVVAVLGLGVSAARAIDWEGDGVTSDWSNGNNWYGLQVPGSGNTAAFGNLSSIKAASNVDTNRTIAYLTVYGPSAYGGDFYFTGSNTTLTISSAFTMAQPNPVKDNVTIESGLTINAADVEISKDSHLTINNGGTVNAANFKLFTSSGNASPSVDIGNGGTLKLTSQTTFNAGTLELDAGGTFIVGLNVGLDVNTSASTLLLNTGWTIPAEASIRPTNGGKVIASSYFNLGEVGNGTLVVDGNGTSVSAGTSAGPASTWGSLGWGATVSFQNSATGSYGDGLQIAKTGGTANVGINSGAALTVTNGLSVGGTSNSFATVTVNNATLSIAAGTTAFADFGNGAELDLQAGGVLFLAGNATFENGSNGSTLNWSGGTINAVGQTLSINGGIASVTVGAIGVNGSTLSINNGGHFDSNNAVNIGTSGSGTLLVNAANSRITSSGAPSYWAYNPGGTAAATLNFSFGGAGTFSNGVNFATAGNAGTLNVGSGGSLTIGSFFVTGGTTAGSAATINLSTGTLNSTGTSSFLKGTTLNLSSGGGLLLGGDAIFATGSNLNWTSGTISEASGHTLAFTGGTFNRNAVTGQSLFNGATLSVSNGGQITGTGNLDIANLNASGTLLADGINTLVSAGSLSDWGRNTGHTATISLSNSAVANLNSLEIGAINAASTVTLASGSALNTSGTLLVGGGITYRNVALNLSGGKLTTTGAATFDFPAFVTQTGGTTTFNGTAAFLSGSTLSLSAGSVNFNNNATFSTGSTFNFSGGSLNVASGKTLEIDGTGTLSNLHTFNTGWTLSVGTAGLVTTPALSIATGGTAATLLVNGTGATLNAIGVSGGSNIANGGTLIVSNGGVANFNTSTFGTPGLSDGLGGGYIQAGPNGGAINLGTLTLGSGSFTSHLNINGGTVNTTSAASFSGSSQISYSSGSFNVGGALSTANTAAITTSAGTVLRTHGLTMSDTSLINLTGGLIDDYTGGSPLTTITGYVTTGRNGGLGGLWKGAGIDSSAAAADPTHHAVGIGEASTLFGASGGTFAGQTVDGTSVLARYTYLGDANLDGKVDVVDLGLLASHWLQSGNWTGGDFNYDGKIDVVDLGELASNWQAGTTGPSSMSFEQAMAFVGLGNTSVPEPAALGALLAATLMLRRRAA